MLVTVRGTVISVKDSGENDKLVTIVTDSLGTIRFFARGAKKLNAKNAAACQLFAYSSFCLESRGERYYLNSSETVSLFFGIRTDVTRFALASYIAEVLGYAVMEEQTSDEAMRLVLNIFWFISEGKRSCALLKSIFELRFACCIGHMPRLAGCDVCAAYEAEKMYFLCGKGILLCGEHFDGCDPEGCFDVGKTLLHTIRYICLTDMEKCFSFDLHGETLEKLGMISEKYLIGHIGRNFASLDFYKGII